MFTRPLLATSHTRHSHTPFSHAALLFTSLPRATLSWMLPRNISLSHTRIHISCSWHIFHIDLFHPLFLSAKLFRSHIPSTCSTFAHNFFQALSSTLADNSFTHSTALSHTTLCNYRCRTISFVFPAFPVQVQPQLVFYWTKLICGVIQSFNWLLIVVVRSCCCCCCCCRCRCCRCRRLILLLLPCCCVVVVVAVVVAALKFGENWPQTCFQRPSDVSINNPKF